MKKKQIAHGVLLAACVFLATTTGCRALKSEISTPAGTTNAPPITTQLQTAATVTQTVLPPPWGDLIASLLATSAAAFAAYAAKHSGAAATSSAAAAASSASTTPAPAPAPKQ